MKRIYSTALIASVATTVLVAPFLAQPLTLILHGGTLDFISILGSADISDVPAWWLSGNFISCLGGLLVTWTLCFLIFLLLVFSSASTQRADDGGVLGRARIKKGAKAINGSATWDGKQSPKTRGFVYGFAKGRYLFEPDRFVLVDGSTGSGKTRFCLIPTLDLLTYNDKSSDSKPHNILVSDVKNELVELTGDELERRGYKVLLLDSQHPMRGNRYNPLRILVDHANQGLTEEAEQEADTIASVIIAGEKSGNAAHWTESARALLSATILLVAFSAECPDEAKNLATVNEVICRGTEGEGQDPTAPLKSAFRALLRNHLHVPVHRSSYQAMETSCVASSLLPRRKSGYSAHLPLHG